MFNTDTTVLLVIDVQGKLASLMSEKEKLFQNLHALIKMARTLNIPIIWTEQRPEKIGRTVPEVADLLKDSSPIQKVTFSCYANERFKEALEALSRRQVLVCGIETHVCVYQTVSDLVESNFEVEVVSDAVSSRTKENKEAALSRMKDAGARLTTTEMITCELLKTSEHPKFKEVLSLIK